MPAAHADEICFYPDTRVMCMQPNTTTDYITIPRVDFEDTMTYEGTNARSNNYVNPTHRMRWRSLEHNLVFISKQKFIFDALEAKAFTRGNCIKARFQVTRHGGWNYLALAGPSHCV